MTRPQKQRLVLVVAGLLVAAVLGRQLVRRGHLLDAARPSEPPRHSDTSLIAPELGRGAATEILRAARALLEGGDADELPDEGDPGSRIVLASLSRSDRPALVARGDGPSLSRALANATTELAGRASDSEIRDGRLKIDVATERGRREILDGDRQTRIDRSLEGLWLTDHDLLLLPEELLSRRLLSADGELEPKRLKAYLAEGGRASKDLGSEIGRAGSPYHRVRFLSLMEGDDRFPLRLYRGNDSAPSVAPAALLAAAVAGGDYLLRHLGTDGRWGYSYRAKKDSYDEGYNLLRHAGTCYALAELYQVTKDDRYLEAARRGIEALLATASPPKPEHSEADFEAIVSPGREAKLGGAALAVLAITEYRTASGDAAFDARAQGLAHFLLHQQQETGRFLSKYFYGPPDPEPFESIYYPGEAILALTRLHRLDSRDDWLVAARKGADWLIEVRDSGKSSVDLPHDHWLLMALDELHDLTGEERYAAHAARIAGAIVSAQRTRADHLDWIGSFYDPPRSTPTATRAEGLVAAYRLAQRTGADSQPQLQALLRMAAFQRRCQLTPSSALYLPRPDRARGGFRRSLTHWEVRIDYVQHNLSALLGVRSILLEKGADR